MKNRYMNLVMVLCVALTLTGCANGYKQFYQPAQGATPEVVATRRAAPPPAVPVVERTKPATADEIIPAYAKRGYFPIGSAMFNSTQRQSDDAAIQQGKDVGAELILLFDPKYVGSQTTVVPITTPTSTTTYSSGSATAYGSGGQSATAYGSGTSTTTGTTTNFVPVTTNRFDYGAVYFYKPRMGLGVVARDLNDSERQDYQTNKGAIIRSVTDNSPAFEADILVGDMITAIDGVTVSNTKNFFELVGQRKGSLVKVSIIRRGQKIEKSVQLAQ